MLHLCLPFAQTVAAVCLDSPAATQPDWSRRIIQPFSPLLFCCLQIFVVGGLQTNMTSYAPFIEVYDPVLDHWEVHPLPVDIEPRAFAAMCTL